MVVGQPARHRHHAGRLRFDLVVTKEEGRVFFCSAHAGESRAMVGILLTSEDHE